jgi:hypothetical protein
VVLGLEFVATIQISPATAPVGKAAKDVFTMQFATPSNVTPGYALLKLVAAFVGCALPAAVVATPLMRSVHVATAPFAKSSAANQPTSTERVKSCGWKKARLHPTSPGI